MQQQLKLRIIPSCVSLILAIASLTLLLPNTAYAQSTQNTSPTQISATSAREVFRAAYENRYTWDEQFPGFSAEVSVNYDGEVYQGIASVKSDLSVEVSNIDIEEIHQLVVNELKMEVIHRRRLPFEKVHGRNSYEFEGTDEEEAMKIREAGDEKDSHYKVKEQVITQVNRILGDVAVKVDTLGTTKTPEGYLVAHFQTIFRDAQTEEILQKQDVRDFHDKIGNYYLLKQ